MNTENDILGKNISELNQQLEDGRLFTPQRAVIINDMIVDFLTELKSDEVLKLKLENADLREKIKYLEGKLSNASVALEGLAV